MKRWLTLLLAGAMAVSVSACSSGEEFAEPSAELNILMPEAYISDALIDDFETANGCTVNLSYQNDVANRYSVLTEGSEAYDLVLVNDGYLASLIEEEQIRKIKHNDLPNTSAINDAYWSSKSYCIPYLMNYIYVVYDSKTCPVEITKYNDLLDPALKGKIAVPDGERELLMMALAALGYAPNSVEGDEIAEAYDWLVKLDENMVVYGDTAQALAEGTVSAAVISDRDAAELMAKNKALKIAAFTKDKIRVEVDLFVVPSEAAHTDLAEKFLNYICDPEVAAGNLEVYPYSSPNEVALTLVSDAYHNKIERQFDYQKNVYFRKDISEAADAYEVFYQKVREIR